jgi:hypothetical protein
MYLFAPATTLTTFPELVERYMRVSTEIRNAIWNFRG